MISFSYLDAMSGLDLLDLLRRFAKANKKVDSSGRALSWHQDQVAISLGFKNWSLLHKHLAAARWSETRRVLNQALEKPGMGEFIEVHAVRTIDEDEAIAEMRRWVRSTYTPLIDFAFYDNESETGFSWPAVELVLELSAEFSGRYPHDLIEKVGNDMELDQGPWGLEEYGEAD
jgi:hypothetical protein